MADDGAWLKKNSHIYPKCVFLKKSHIFFYPRPRWLDSACSNALSSSHIYPLLITRDPKKRGHGNSNRSSMDGCSKERVPMEVSLSL